MDKTLSMDLAARPASAAPVLVSVALSSFMVALDVTALNVVLPSIGHDLATGMDRLQWIAGAYTLVFASLMLSAGVLSDRLGARKVFLLALLVFTGASVACGLAPSVVELIAARAIQGIGAALMLPSSMALLVEAYPDAKARARAVALWGGISALALVSGPMLGGLLVELVDWRSIFYLNVPFCLIALGCCALRRSRLVIQPRSIDWSGQVLSALALVSLVFALIEGPVWGWSNTWVIATVLVALVSGVAFIYSQKTRREPMLPLNLFESRTFSAAIGAGFLQTLAYYGSLFVLPFALQGQGRTSLEIGLAMIPMTIATGVMASLSGRLSNAFGARSIGAAGMLCGALGAALLALYGLDRVSLMIGGLLIGLGGATLPVIVGACLASVPSGKVGVGSGALNAARQCGGVTGIALLGATLEGPGRATGALSIIALAFVAAGLLTVLRLYTDEVDVVSEC
ncbi:DHA2 family efflux MFS transporter permease subunit [Pseudomonas guariconensis]|uniref:DHA2 family efflux MFS transporter permease subunit n=1 Tax=Pseudomonas guariconensis TaxID=1288410 RepID=UPI0018A90EA2|nr:DHA2 family efflux MFS transporter permease subunit [Pseudomonas guariconensis]MBF8740645.1 DHA2 family efflux MFS transporter permease subunit [Pseudomonas guariconensis]MBF8749825.1 DHA2 family efflux MFS transporter permease subunit [Pseudomonas guariconensis]